MSTCEETDAEIEKWRQSALGSVLIADPANFAPGTFGCHEALHSCHVMLSIIESHLANHPAILLNADWYRRVARATDELAKLYQEIGAAIPVPRPAPRPPYNMVR